MPKWINGMTSGGKKKTDVKGITQAGKVGTGHVTQDKVNKPYVPVPPKN